MIISRYSVVLSLCMTFVICAPLKQESDDVKSILEDILKRLDEKETRISQLETIVRVQDATMREQQEQMTALEEEVALQKVMIQDLQEKTEMETQFDYEKTDPDTDESSRIKTGSFYLFKDSFSYYIKIDMLKSVVLYSVGCSSHIDKTLQKSNISYFLECII